MTKPTHLGITSLPKSCFRQPLQSPPAPCLSFKIPRVVANQKEKFTNDQLFRQIARVGELRYSEHHASTHVVRQQCFMAGCYQGHTEVSLVSTGTNLQLYFNSNHNPNESNKERECVFQKELGKVHISSRFIMNGVCVRFRGSLNMEQLDGYGRLEYDEQMAKLEHAKLLVQTDINNQMLRVFARSKNNV